MSAAGRVFGGCRVLMYSVSAAPAKVVTKADAVQAKKLRGIMRPVPVSAVFRKFAGGTAHVSRAGALKIVWDHIKANNLQNPENKKEINCDEKLKSIFVGRDKIGMMEITKLLNPHFAKTN